MVDLQSHGVVSRGRPFSNFKDGVAPHYPDISTADELTELGACVELHDEEHTVGHNMFYVSVYIPRVNDFETGIPGHVTLCHDDGKWIPVTEIADERHMVVRVKNHGLVVFSACSHAGINHVCRDALQKVNNNSNDNHHQQRERLFPSWAAFTWVEDKSKVEFRVPLRT